MKKIAFLIAIASFLFSSSLTSAQNLVPNWSFEDTVSCPSGIGGITNSLGWNSFRNTPDYLNSCNSGQVNVPSNLFGFQLARTGNAYGGIYTYGGGGIDYREYIGIELTQSLIIGGKYFISFYASRGINNQINVRSGVATNKIGAMLSTVSFSSVSPLSIKNFAQIYTDSIIMDTASWTNVSGSFIADSAYNFICVGNFFNDSLTAFYFDSNSVNAYYYIDDVSISLDSISSVFDIDNIVGINVYPNPTIDVVNIENTAKSYIKILVQSILGQTVYESSSAEIKYTIDFTKYSAGVYTAIIYRGDEIIKIKILKY